MCVIVLSLVIILVYNVQAKTLVILYKEFDSSGNNLKRTTNLWFVLTMVHHLFRMYLKKYGPFVNLAWENSTEDTTYECPYRVIRMFEVMHVSNICRRLSRSNYILSFTTTIHSYILGLSPNELYRRI